VKGTRCVDAYTDVPANRFLVLTEGSNPSDVPDLAARPGASCLRQNAPNPFRPSTSIGFSTPSAGDVRLRIFDGAGRLVRTLVDEPRAAGRWLETWDGRDAAGRPVAAGVYLYRLEVTGEGGRRVDETRKMTLLK
jgi:hypothetical protein